MAKAKSRSTAKTKTSRSSSRSKQSKSLVSNINLRDKKVFGLFIALIAVVGIALVGFSSAASTSFEAEGVSASSNVVQGEDLTLASGGKYVQFSVADATPTNAAQRFPGDPNPKVTGKAYVGADQLEGTTYKSRFEDPTGKSISTARRFYSSWSQRNNVAAQATADLATNRLPMYSIKGVGWTEMASGSRDAEIDSFLKSLDAVNGPVWLIVHHEPDGGSKNQPGPKNEDDVAGAAGWVKMQKKFRERITALKVDNVAFMAAFTGGWGSDFHQPKDNWYSEGTHDAIFIDHYAWDMDKQVASKADWAEFSDWAAKKDMPHGTAELGLRSGDADGVGYFLPTSDCTKLVPRGITAEQDKKAGMRLQEFWEWGFKNNRDVIAHAYFDKCINSGASPYALGGEQLKVWRDSILGSDSRVMRVNQLKTGTTTTNSALPTTYGNLKGTISVPADGDYTLWVRMQVPDTTNNAVQVQVGTGTVMKVGDGGIPAGTWTWVNWKNGDKANVNDLKLLGGNHEVKITGIEKGVKIDRIIVANQTCKPDGFGDKCTVIAPDEPDPTPTRSTAITSPVDGQPLSGKVTVKVSTTGNADFVSFRPNDVFANTDYDANANGEFEWVWDTTTLPDGAHTLYTRTNFEGDAGTVFTVKKVNVTIKNATPVPVDTTAPAPVTNLNKAIGFNFTSFKCGTKLTWSASTSGDVAGYKVVREGLNTKTSALEYVDQGLVVGKAYTYSVSAYDKVGNTSKAVTIGAKYNQFLGWCWFE